MGFKEIDTGRLVKVEFNKGGCTAKKQIEALIREREANGLILARIKSTLEGA